MHVHKVGSACISYWCNTTEVWFTLNSNIVYCGSCFNSLRLCFWSGESIVWDLLVCELVLEWIDTCFRHGCLALSAASFASLIETIATTLLSSLILSITGIVFTSLTSFVPFFTSLIFAPLTALIRRNSRRVILLPTFLFAFLAVWASSLLTSSVIFVVSLAVSTSETGLLLYFFLLSPPSVIPARSNCCADCSTSNAH